MSESEGSEVSVDNQVIPKDDFEIPEETIWERLATINTTEKYERSFELLSKGIRELVSSQVIPPIFMLKKKYLI